MAEDNFKIKADIYKALGHKSRLRILKELSDSENGLQPLFLAQILKIGIPSLYFHLDMLMKNKLIKAKKIKEKTFYYINPKMDTFIKERI
ncbi:MAG: winged helix-turn-helix domain-containing protein [Alphaproteobacteria bacterium]